MRERELRELESLRELQAARQRYWESLFKAAFEMSETELRAQLKSRSADRRFVATYVVGERLLEWPSELTALLEDHTEAVRLAARRSLIILSFLALNPQESLRIRALRTGVARTPTEKPTPPVDFGPQPGASKDARAEAVKRWKEWWAPRSPKEPSLVAQEKPPPAGSELEQLAAALTQADLEGRQRALARCRDTKGAKYTAALALAIAAQSGGEERKQLREALAARMTRLTDKTLVGYLEDEDAEVRRAALLGLAFRESKGCTANVIEMLLDPQPAVSWAAYTALRSLTGQDFGPQLPATEEDKILSAARWRKWWEEKGRPRGG
jgi:hypothetical protein